MFSTHNKNDTIQDVGDDKDHYLYFNDAVVITFSGGSFIKFHNGPELMVQCKIAKLCQLY